MTEINRNTSESNSSSEESDAGVVANPPGKQKSIHLGHRQRMKNRFAKYGLENFDDHNVLELILFYSIPRRDTNPIAHKLLDSFGSLSAILDAPIEALTKVDGINENSALLIKLIPQISRRYLISRIAHDSALTTSAQAGQYLIPFFAFEKHEVVYLMCLDSMQRVISCDEISRGVVTAAEVNIRKIAELALRNNAASVILSHNHPDGLAIPSVEDRMTTKQIKDALESVGVGLTDHIVVAGNDFVSMADSMML